MEIDHTPTADQPKGKRRWYQYSLRTLMIVVTLFAVACSWFAVKLQQAKRQKYAALAIMELGGFVGYEYEMTSSRVRLRGATPALAWLRGILGDDFFNAVIYVNLSGKNISADYKGRIAVLDNSTDMDVSAGNKVQIGAHRIPKIMSISDIDLECLRDLEGLQYLDLSGTEITDEGMKNLKGLHQLQFLSLDGAQITDVSLEYLKRLKQLKNLNVANTRITSEGLEELKNALPKAKITN